eukprot:gene6726-10891_t
MSGKAFICFFTLLFMLSQISAVPVDCISAAQVLSEDTEEFLFAESLGLHYVGGGRGSQPIINVAHKPVFTNIQIPYMDLATQLQQKFLANILLHRRFDNSPCSDKKVCEYNCASIFPKCSGQHGFIDFTTQYNQDVQQQLAYNWVCKKNLFSSTNQKTSYFSIIFRVLVSSVTDLSETDFEAEIPNADVTNYDNLFIDWNENKGINGNVIAVLRALELYKEGLKGFLLLCSEEANGFTDIETKLDEYETEARETVDSKNQYVINSDSTASAQQRVDNWGKLAKAITNVANKAKTSGMSMASFKTAFTIKDNKATRFSKFNAKSFIDKRSFSLIANSLGKKGKNDGNLKENDYYQRVVLYNQLKQSLRNSFIEMVQGNSEQRDFCQCSDYNRFFKFFNDIPSSVALGTYGIDQNQLGFQYDYYQNFENICRSKCPTSSKCENNGIKKKTGICSYNLFDINIVQNQQYPIKMKRNEALKFEMGGNDVYVLLSTGTAINSVVYRIVLGGWGNTKSSISIGKVGESGTFVHSSTLKTVNSSPFDLHEPIWITFYMNEIKVGRSNFVGSGEIMSQKLSSKRLYTFPTHVGFGKHSSAPRCDIVNARFEPCSGNGKKLGSFKCKCAKNFFGSLCEKKKKIPSNKTITRNKTVFVTNKFVSKKYKKKISRR